ncbi:MAG: DUF86 domain-containing protein [Chloroflexi bacterium]|nr:DUF86 domain-containing protein [Chloroflexota bacterium]
MPEDDLLYFGHMLDMARKVVAKTKGITRADYDNDEDLRLAVTHLIQTIGEAAGRISEEGRTAHAEIPWREITGMRHKIVHDYMNVDEDVVWEVATKDLPPLTELLEKIVPPEDATQD